MRFLPAVLCLLGLSASAQEEDTARKTTDIYKGVISDNKKEERAILSLRHCHFCDYGTFTLSTATGTSFAGDWTVLRGDAANKNATVVELDAADKAFFFLRKPTGELQQEDSALKVIAPAATYVLRQQVIKLGGTYKGWIPSSVCNKIETTVTMDCHEPCTGGSCVVSIKYVGTPTGDHVYNYSGTWTKQMDTVAGRPVIAMSGSKPEWSRSYFIADDGALLPTESVDDLFDGRLEKQ